jgi:hypothetical protein
MQCEMNRQDKPDDTFTGTDEFWPWNPAVVRARRDNGVKFSLLAQAVGVAVDDHPLIALPMVTGHPESMLELRTPHGYVIRLSNQDQVRWLGGVLAALR